MFGELFKAAKAVTDLAGATIGVAVKPVKDGVEFITEGLREITDDGEES